MVNKVSHRQACKCVGLNRSNYFYKLKRTDDTEVIYELTLLTQKHVTIGFWQCYHRLRRKGFKWNLKKFTVPDGINQVWSIDFMSGSLWNGRKFRLLNVVDDYNREMLAMEADTSLPASRVTKNP